MRKNLKQAVSNVACDRTYNVCCEKSEIDVEHAVMEPSWMKIQSEIDVRIWPVIAGSVETCQQASTRP
jgi:hypothetical protein